MKTSTDPISEISKILKVEVINMEKIVYQGKAKTVSSVNEKGPFDILPSHENFISIIEKKVVIIHSDNQKKEFKVEQGILKVQNNKIWVFLGVPQTSGV